MKTILLIIIALTTSVTLNAQIEIQLDGIGPDLSGTIVDFNVDENTPSPYDPRFYITNNTGADQQWRITRVKQSVPTTWNDAIVWIMGWPASGDIYTTASTPGTPAPIVVNGTYFTTNSETADFKPYIIPDGLNGVALYMYYITDNNDNYADSIGVRFNYVLDVKENTSDLSVSVAPNPANSFVNITTSGVQGTSVKIVDVLGNVVLKETVTGSSKTINTESFRNGVYFVRVETDNQRTVNRKLIIRHD